MPGCCEAQSGKQGKLLAPRLGLLLSVSSGSFQGRAWPSLPARPPWPSCARVSLQVEAALRWCQEKEAVWAGSQAYL